MNNLLERPASMFRSLRNSVDSIVSGKSKCLIVYGPTGLGKTHTVRETLNQRGLRLNKNYSTICGVTTAMGVYQKLFSCRKDQILVYDNTDGVLTQSKCVEVLTAAVDTSGDYCVSWSNTRSVCDVSNLTPEERDQYCANVDESLKSYPGKHLKYPNKFKFNGGVIIITNLEKKRFNKAILSVSDTIEIDMDDYELISYMQSILPNLGSNDVKLEVKQEILDKLIDLHANGLLDRTLDIRTFGLAEKLKEHLPDSWISHFSKM